VQTDPSGKSSDRRRPGRARSEAANNLENCDLCLKPELDSCVTTADSPPTVSRQHDSFSKAKLHCGA